MIFLKRKHALKDVEFWIDNSEILHCTFKNVTNNNYKLSLSIVKRYINIVAKLCDGKPMPFLIDLREAKGTFSILAAKLLASSPKLKQVRLSEAYIVNSMKMKLVINTYKRIYEPVTPFQFFDNLEDGIDYCLTIKKDIYGGEH